MSDKFNLIGFVVEIQWPTHTQESVTYMSLQDVLKWLKEKPEQRDKAMRELATEFMSTTVGELHHQKQWAVTLKNGTTVSIECLFPEARKPITLENLEGILQ